MQKASSCHGAVWSAFISPFQMGLSSQLALAFVWASSVEPAELYLQWDQPSSATFCQPLPEALVIPLFCENSEWIWFLRTTGLTIAAEPSAVEAILLAEGVFSVSGPGQLPTWQKLLLVELCNTGKACKGKEKAHA